MSYDHARPHRHDGGGMMWAMSARRGFVAAIVDVIVRWLRALVQPSDDVWGRDRALLERILETDITGVNAIDSGVARVVGRVKASGPLLRAPLTGNDCVAFEFLVLRPSESSDDIEYRRGQSASFVVEDETGCAWIDGCVFVRFCLATQNRGAFGSDISVRSEREHVQRLDIPVQASTFLPRLRWAEGRLVPGEWVTVCGRCSVVQAEDATTAEARAAGCRVVFRGTPEHPVIISNVHEAGRP